MNDEEKKIADNLINIMIKKLRLDITKEEFTYDMPLFEEGLDLDSVDIMELISIIDSEYEVSMTDDDKKYFKNMEVLSEFILKQIEEAK